MSRQASATPRLEEGDGGEVGPGQAYTPFMTMEYLLDKLKLLNYETEIVVKMRMRPLNRCLCSSLLP